MSAKQKQNLKLTCRITGKSRNTNTAYLEKEGNDTKFYTPQENMKVEFSGGDTPHGVTQVTSECGKERCMIVCEQYKLSLRCLKKIQQLGDPILRKG